MSARVYRIQPALNKARESALLAVEVYNKPAISFKSGGYIVLMVIAWTALFHAIFYKRRKRPFSKDEKGRLIFIEGEQRLWELSECLRQYYRGIDSPVRKNLEMFIPLRNMIEHRSMPDLDATIFGECQAMLLNFDDLIGHEFGAKYRIRESLTFSLQLFPSTESLTAAVKHRGQNASVLEFLQKYRSTLSSEVDASGKFSFKAFLIQVANHPSNSALSVQFVHYDKMTAEQKAAVNPFIAAIKLKEMPVPHSPDLMKPGKVVEKVSAALDKPTMTRANGTNGPKYNLSWHSRCWQHYMVRPAAGASNPAATVPKYCQYDKLNANYGYTQEWVDYLISEMKKPGGYEAIIPLVLD